MKENASRKLWNLKVFASELPRNFQPGRFSSAAAILALGRGLLMPEPSPAQPKPQGAPVLTTCHFWRCRPNDRVSMSSKIAPAAAERAQVPGHIAIIMDGNGRWAKQRGLPRIEGHRRGVETVRTVTFA